MKKFIIYMLMFMAIITISAKNLPTIAIAEPEAKGGIKPADISAISDYIESKISDTYNIYSRASLRPILRELEFNNSGLVFDGELQNGLEQKSVKYLFAYTISKLENKYAMSMRVVECLTGKIVPKQRTVVLADNLTQLYSKIDMGLDDMGLLAVAKAKTKSMVVMPVKTYVSIPNNIMRSFEAKFNSKLVNSNMFNLLTRSDLDAILKENNIATSSIANANQLYKIANLDIADYILMPEILRLDNRKERATTTIAGATNGKERFYLQLNIKVLDCKTGKIIAQKEFDELMTNLDVPIELRRDFQLLDYYNYFFDKTLTKATAYLVQNITNSKVVVPDEQKTLSDAPKYPMAQ